MSTVPTSEILNRAADLIERDGWWRGGVDCSGPAPACAANALLRVGLATGTGVHIVYQAQRALESHLGVSTVADIFRWNDDPSRTKSEVIEVLRACAVIEASRERESAEVTA